MPSHARPAAGNVDTQALGECLRLAGEGAESAAGVLAGFAGVEFAVDSTAVTVLGDGDLQGPFDEAIGLTVDLDGGFPGQTLLAFDRADADCLLEQPPENPDGPLDADHRSSLRESANLIVSELAEGLAARLGGLVELSPPTFHDRLDDSTLLADSPGSGALAFESRLSGGGVTVTLLTVPRGYAVEYLLTDRPADDPDVVPLSAVEALDDAACDGASAAAELLAEIADIRCDIETSRLQFAAVDGLTDRFGDGRVTGTVFGLNDGRDGYLAVLLDEASAHTVTDAMVPAGAESVGIGTSAVTGLSRALASGFLEGWTDRFADVTLTSPATVAGDGTDVLAPVLRRVSRECEHTFTVEATLSDAETGVSCQLFALPADHHLATLDGAQTP